MKKLFVIIVLMALAMNGIAQILNYDFSAECETGQTLYYRISSEEEHTVTLTHPYSEENEFHGDYYEGFTQPQGDIILPSIVDYNGVQYFVTAIDKNAFGACHLTGTLTIPEGIVSIGACAFEGCLFTTISIPRSTEVISSASYGYGTPFGYCSSLESIIVDEANPVFYSENNALIKRQGKVLVQGCKTTIIPDDVEAIGRSSFQGAGDGGNLVIPNSVTSIDEYAFHYCNFSGTLVLSDSLRYIGTNAFSESSFTGSLSLPNTVTEIGAAAFANCGFSGDLILPSSITSINTRSFCSSNFSGTLVIPNSVTYIGLIAFEGTNFSELVLGNSLEQIDNHAFNNRLSNTNLTGVLRLPASLTEIGISTFAYTSFDEIYSPNTTPPSLDNSSFYECDPNIPVHIPFGCTETYQNAEGWSYFSNFIETELNLEGEWFYEILDDDGTITYQHLECAADTTIGTERPKIIVRSNTIYDRNEHTEVTHEYVFERDGKVYWWNKNLEEFTTLYDLTAEAGDEWEIKVGTQSLTMHVDAVENYEYENQQFRMLQVSDANNLFSGSIVCGIGHLTSFFPERLMNRGKGYRIEGMRCYWVEDNLVFKYGDTDCDAIYAELHNGINEDGPSTGSGAFVVYPNPANNILFVETRLIASLPDQTYRITNLIGQNLLTGNISAETQQIDISTLPSGMYFINVGETTLKFVIR